MLQSRLHVWDGDQHSRSVSPNDEMTAIAVFDGFLDEEHPTRARESY